MSVQITQLHKCSDHPKRRDNFQGKNISGHARRHSAVICEKWLNRSRCHLDCGLG